MDPLLNELCALCTASATPSSAASTEEGGAGVGQAIRSSVLSGLANALQKCGDKATPASLEKVKTAVISCITEDDEELRINAAKCIAGLAGYFDANQAADLLYDLLKLPTTSPVNNTGAVDAGRVLALSAALQTAGSRASADLRDEVCQAIKAGFGDERIPVRVAACRYMFILYYMLYIVSGIILY